MAYRKEREEWNRPESPSRTSSHKSAPWYRNRIERDEPVPECEITSSRDSRTNWVDAAPPIRRESRYDQDEPSSGSSARAPRYPPAPPRAPLPLRRNEQALAGRTDDPDGYGESKDERSRQRSPLVRKARAADPPPLHHSRSRSPINRSSKQTSGSSAGNSFSKGSPGERYRGFLKPYAGGAAAKFRFIICELLFESYGKDVFMLAASNEEAMRMEAGTEVSFRLEESRDGKPQATDVRPIRAERSAPTHERAFGTLRQLPLPVHDYKFRFIDSEDVWNTYGKDALMHRSNNDDDSMNLPAGTPVSFRLTFTEDGSPEASDVRLVEESRDRSRSRRRSPIARTGRPRSPIARPRSPIARPRSPIARPRSPLARHRSPVARPRSPIARPRSPTARPSSHIVRSSSPVARPSSPVARPRSPITRQRSPIARPRSPPARPRSPVTRPRSPVARPRSPIARPRSPIARPRSQIARPRSPTARSSSPAARPRSPKTWPCSPRSPLTRLPPRQVDPVKLRSRSQSAVSVSRSKKYHGHMKKAAPGPGAAKFRFISCDEVMDSHGADVFVHPSKNEGAMDLEEGVHVSFRLILRQDGKPQAVDVQADGHEDSSVRYDGVMKQPALEKNNYKFRFISCPDVEKTFGCDVFMHAAMVGDKAMALPEGTDVNFQIAFSENGRPQATDVQQTWGSRRRSHERSRERGHEVCRERSGQRSPLFRKAEADVGRMRHLSRSRSPLVRNAEPLREKDWRAARPRSRSPLARKADAPPRRSRSRRSRSRRSRSPLVRGSGGAVGHKRPSDQRYRGVMKKVPTGDIKFRFITCDELFRKYGNDVFMHATRAPEACGLDESTPVSFKVEESCGKPQAYSVRPLEGKVRCYGVMRRPALACHDHKFRFIRSEEVLDDYGVDVFMHVKSNGEDAMALKEGVLVSFKVNESDDGRPQATDTKAAWTGTLLPVDDDDDTVRTISCPEAGEDVFMERTDANEVSMDLPAGTAVMFELERTDRDGRSQAVYVRPAGNYMSR